MCSDSSEDYLGSKYDKGRVSGYQGNFISAASTTKADSQDIKVTLSREQAQQRKILRISR
jgi:hypothetical protein